MRVPKPDVAPIPARPGDPDQRPMYPTPAQAPAPDAPLFVRSNAIAARAYEMAKEQGLPANHVVAILKQESNFDPTRRPISKDGKALSSAFGIGQLLSDERSKTGIGDSTDPETQLRAVMPKMRDAYDRAKKALGREPTPGEMYVVYYQGAGAGPRILANPNASLKDTLDGVKPGWGDKVYGANPWLARDGITTNADFIAWTSGKMNAALGAKDVPTNFTRTIARSETSPPYPLAGSPADDAMLQERVAFKPTPTFWQTVEAAADETVTSYVFRDSPVFAPAPDYKPTIEELEARKEGLPEKYHDRLIGVSPAHSDYLTQQAHRQFENEAALSEAGWTGTGVSLLSGLVDPVPLALGIATGGLGSLAGEAFQAGRMVQRVAAGAGAAAGNVAAVGLGDSLGRATEGSEYAYAAALGMGLGFTFGPLARNPATQDIADAGAHAMNRATADMRRAGSGEAGDLGAAATTGHTLEFSAADIASMGQDEATTTALAQAPRFDMAGRSGQSKNPLVRALGNVFGFDATGRVGPDGERATQAVSVGEMQARLQRGFAAHVYDVARPQFDEWAKANGYSYFWDRIPGGSAWRQFGQEVYAYIGDRRVDADAYHAAQVKRVGDALRDVYARLQEGNLRPRDYAPNNPGKPLAGWENAVKDAFYQPRKWKVSKILAVDGAGRTFQDWVEGALLSAHPELGDKAGTIARGMFKNLVGREYGIDEFMMMARNGATADVMRASMKEIGMADDEIEEVLARLPKGGKPGFTHYKLDLDDSFVLKDQYRLADFVEDNAFDLFENYNRRATGWWALGTAQIANKEGKVLLDGIRSAKEFEDLLHAVKDRGLAAGQTPEQIAKDEALLREQFDRIRGVPRDGAGNTVDKALELARNVSTMLFGGSFGLSALGDAGRLMSLGSVRAFIQHIPAFRQMIDMGGERTYRRALTRDLNAIHAYHNEFRPFSTGFDADQGLMTASEGALGKVLGATRVGADAVVRLSGMPAINRRIKEWAAGIMTQRLYDNAKRVFDRLGDAEIDLSRLSAAERERMKWFGLDDDMLKRVLTQLREHAEAVPGFVGDRVHRLHPEKWDDPEALNAFVTAIQRAAGRASMEQDVIGSGTVFDRSPVFRSLLQLRRFSLNAWHQNILHAGAMRDGEAFADVVASTFTAAMLYVARTHMKAAAADDPEDYRRKHFSTRAIAAATFELSAYSSLLPALVDTIGMNFIGADPLFGYRNSGLPSNGIFGNPTFATTDAILQAPGAAIRPIVTGRPRSQQEWRQMLGIIPFQNNFAVQSAIGAMTHDAPKRPPKDGHYSLSDALFGPID